MIVKNVENIKSLYKKISLKYNINEDKISFHILNTTYFNSYNKSSFNLISLKDLLEIYDNPAHDFKETYDLNIFQKKHDLHFTLLEENNGEELQLILHDKFVIYDNLFKDIEKEIINMGALYLGGINDRDKERIINNIKHKKERKILLRKANLFRHKRQEKFYFIALNDMTQDAKIINFNRAYIAVKEGGLVAKKIKESQGIDGRNLYGKYIKNSNENHINSAVIIPKFSSDIVETQDEDNIYFHTKKSGFLIVEKISANIVNKLNFKSIEAKDKYIFVGDIDTDTLIEINSNDEFEDTIKGPLTLIANKIIVNGNIGASVTLKANEINIKGQTHKNTNFYANKVSFTLLRGSLVATDAKIDRVEGGEIKTLNIDINSVSGGTIRGRNININDLYSNSFIKFSKKLNINNIKGAGNNITFSALGEPTLYNDIKTMRIELKKIFDELKQLYLLFDKNSYKLNSLKSLSSYNEGNIPEYLKRQYQDFIKIGRLVKNIKLKITALENQKKSLHSKLYEVQNIIDGAEFICSSSSSTANDLCYELPDEGRGIDFNAQDRLKDTDNKTIANKYICISIATGKVHYLFKKGEIKQL